MTKSYKEIKRLKEGSNFQVQESCWDGYKQVGMIKKGDRMVPNCVKEEIVHAVFGKDYIHREPIMEDGMEDMYKGKLNKDQIATIKNTWKNKKASDVTQGVRDMVKKFDTFTRMDLKRANIKYISNLINDEVQQEEVDFISPLQDQIEIVEMNSVVRKTELNEFTTDQINSLAKSYASMSGKTISLANANKLRKMFDRVPDSSLNALRKKKIPFLSGLALSRMIQKKISVTEGLNEKKADFLRLTFANNQTVKKVERWLYNNLGRANPGYMSMIADDDFIDFEDMNDADGVMTKLKKAGFSFKVDMRWNTTSWGEDLNKDDENAFEVSGVENNGRQELNEGYEWGVQTFLKKHGYNVSRFSFRKLIVPKSDVEDVKKLLKKETEKVNGDVTVMPNAIIGEAKEEELEESDAYDNDRFIIIGNTAKKDNSDTPDNKNHVYAPDSKTALQLYKQGKKVYKEELQEGIKIAQLVGKSIAHLEMYVELAEDIKKEYFKSGSKVSPFVKTKADQASKNVPKLIKELRKPGIWTEQLEEADLTKPQVKQVHKQADELPKKDFIKRYGKDGDAIRYATATNQVKKKLGLGENKYKLKGELKMSESYKQRFDSAMGHLGINSLGQLNPEEHKPFFAYVDNLKEGLSAAQKKLPPALKKGIKKDAAKFLKSKDGKNYLKYIYILSKGDKKDEQWGANKASGGKVGDKKKHEDLTPKQKQLDKDKDGDIGADDLAKLRATKKESVSSVKPEVTVKDSNKTAHEGGDKKEKKDADMSKVKDSPKPEEGIKKATASTQANSAQPFNQTEDKKYLQTKPGSLEEAILKSRGLIK